MCEKVITKCRQCRQPIEDDAKVCHNCGRHQNLFWQHFRVEQLGILASIIMVMVAYSQLGEARQKRIDADKALNQAIEAKDIATKAAARSQSSEQSIKNLDEAVRKLALSITRITWLQLKTKGRFDGETARIVATNTLNALDRLLQFAIPDTNERAKWIQETEELLPKRK